MSAAMVSWFDARRLYLLTGVVCVCVCVWFGCVGTLTRGGGAGVGYPHGNPSSPRDYDGLKQQYDKANGELSTLRRRCDHAMKVGLHSLQMITLY